MATLTAYLAHSCLTPADLLGNTQEDLASRLTFSNTDMRDHSGWLDVGTAAIVVTLKSHDEIVVDTIAALRRTQSLMLARAQAEITRIDAEIGKLLAITNEVTA